MEEVCMTADDIHKALRTHVFRGDYAYLKNFRAGTGYSDSSNRYLDAWCMQLYPSKPMLVIAVEIKISRADFCRELNKPMKRSSALRISNQFYFAAPAGMIKESELPDEAGLIEVNLDGVAAIVSEAPHREFQITLPFLASLARHAERKNGEHL